MIDDDIDLSHIKMSIYDPRPERIKKYPNSNKCEMDYISKLTGKKIGQHVDSRECTIYDVLLTLKDLYQYNFSFSCIFEYYYSLIDKVITDNNYLLSCDLNHNNNEIIEILIYKLKEEIENSIGSNIEIGLPLEYLTDNSDSQYLRSVVLKWLCHEIEKRNFT